MVEQVELPRRERHGLVPDRHLPRIRVYPQPVEVEHDTVRLPGLIRPPAHRPDPGAARPPRRLRPPEDGPDPGDQLTRGERLDHVIVRAEAKAQDPIPLLAPSGQHDQGYPSLSLDPAAHLDTAYLWQHQVEHDQPGTLAPIQPDSPPAL